MISVTDASFKEEVLDFDGTVFVDFWAPWCAPCKVILPIYENLAAELSSESVKFVKYEAGSDDCNNILQEYSISGLPTVIAFETGDNLFKFIGAGDLAGFVRRVLEFND